jgi:hypothetical protein
VAGKAWIYNYSNSTSNIECYQYDGYVDPGFAGSAAAPNVSGVANAYATDDLLSASPAPQATSSQGLCQEISGD